MASWKNIPGCTSVEIGYDANGNLFDLHTDKDLGEEFKELKQFVPADGCEIVIYFLSSGFHTPASNYGGPDGRGWPAEGEEERVLENCTINGKTLPRALERALFEHYESQINETDIDR